MGGTIHAVWTSLFVVATETVTENRRGVAGGVLNFGERLLNKKKSNFINKSTVPLSDFVSVSHLGLRFGTDRLFDMAIVAKII